MIILDSRGEPFSAGDTDNTVNGTKLELDDTTGAFRVTAKGGSSSINTENGLLRIGDDGSGQNTFLLIQDDEQKTTLNAEAELNLTSAGNILLGLLSGARVRIDHDNSRISFWADKITLDGVPTSDPRAGGQIWSDDGTLKMSAG